MQNESFLVVSKILLLSYLLVQFCWWLKGKKGLNYVILGEFEDWDICKKKMSCGCFGGSVSHRRRTTAHATDGIDGQDSLLPLSFLKKFFIFRILCELLQF